MDGDGWSHGMTWVCGFLIGFFLFCFVKWLYRKVIGDGD